MDFIKKDPATGENIVLGTTRTKLRDYYKNEFPFNSLNKMFNEFAPEITGKQIFSSKAVAKIILGMGLGHVTIEEKALY